MLTVSSENGRVAGWILFLSTTATVSLHNKLFIPTDAGIIVVQI